MRNLLFFIACLSLSTGAYAQPRFYIGADYGYSHSDYNNMTVFSGKLGEFVKNDVSSIIPYIGLTLNDYSAIEVGYTQAHLRQKEYHGMVIQRPDVQTDTLLKGYYIDLIGHYPLNNRLDLVGAAGYQHTKIELELTFPTYPLIEKEHSRFDGLRLGVGMQYALSDHVRARGMVRYIGLNSEDTYQYTLGLSYSF